MIEATAYEFGPFRLNAAERSLFRNSEIVPLPPKVLEVLVLLVERRGEIVDKEVFFQTVWSGSFVEESNLTQSVFVLRKTLSEGNGSQTYIETIPKRGYRFTADVRVVADAPRVQPFEPAATITASLPEASLAANRRRFMWVAGAGAVAAGVAVASRMGRWPLGSHRDTVALAVLPFQNLSGDAAQEHIADGLTDGLTGALGRVRSLRVRSRTSVMRFKGSQKAVGEIARELGVSTVVEGSVTRSGDRERVVCQLIDTAEDSHLWAETYDRPVHDLPTLMTAIAGQIAKEVRVRVSDDERKRLAAKGSTSVEAFEACLRGRHLLGQSSADSVKKAFEEFKRAIRADAGYAPAYVGLSDCYTREATVDLSVRRPREGRALAIQAARQASEIDPDLAEAHAARAMACLFDWEWDETEEAIRQALELNPSSVRARYSQAHYLVAHRRFDEALQEARLVAEQDPFSPSMRSQPAWILQFARRFDEAIVEFQRIARDEPRYTAIHDLLGMTHLNQGRPDLAIPPLEKSLVVNKRSAYALGLLSQAYAATGRKAEALPLLNELLEMERRTYVTPCLISLIYLALKKRDEFFQWFERAYEERSHRMLWIKLDTWYDPVREDPRFQRIEESIFQRGSRSA